MPNHELSGGFLGRGLGQDAQHEHLDPGSPRMVQVSLYASHLLPSSLPSEQRPPRGRWKAYGSSWPRSTAPSAWLAVPLRDPVG